VDVYETEEEYLIVADLPGVAPAALEVTVTSSELTIRGNRDVHSEIRRGQTVRIERERGEFYRRIHLSQAVDRDRVETRFEHGQLIVRLPKRGQANASGTRP
jgi:HSP20 family protein